MRIGLQTWGSEGDVRPFTAPAAGLVMAGHDVTLVVTTDAGRDYASLAQRYGFALRTVAIPIRQNPEDTASIWQAIISAGNPIKQAEMIMTHGFDPVMEDMYTAARGLCAGNDLVIGHFFVFPLRVAAAKAGVPMATVHVVHNCIPSNFLCPKIRESLLPFLEARAASSYGRRQRNLFIKGSTLRPIWARRQVPVTDICG